MSDSSTAKTPPEVPEHSSELDSASEEGWNSAEESFLRAAAASPEVAPPQPETNRVGTQFGRYRIIAEIGRGGMGIVYAAEDKKLRRRVALKVLPDRFAADADRRQRFLREARATSTITHPNVATVFEVDEIADSSVYIAMELVEGHTLRSRLRDGALPVAEAVGIGREILLGLAKAHESGIVHRDLKPDNVMVTPTGSVKLLDFGLAKPIGTREVPLDSDTTDHSDIVTVEGRVLGTPSYMSPEQAKGDPVDQRSDIFSFGVVLYEMLGGRKPFVATGAVALLIAIDRDRPKRLSSVNPAVPRALERIVERCLAKRPEDRFANCDDLVRALAAQASAPSWPRPAAVVIAVVALAALGGVLARARAPHAQPPAFSAEPASEEAAQLPATPATATSERASAPAASASSLNSRDAGATPKPRPKAAVPKPGPPEPAPALPTATVGLPPRF